jgi:peptidoglycan/LPS O-acetylase OafA/YrhL
MTGSPVDSPFGGAASMESTAAVPRLAAAPATSLFVEKLRGPRLPCLDGLRGIAVYMVVLTHMGVLARDGNVGPFAVNIFFVISGFLITHLLIRECEETARVSLKHFYIRRTLRIFPAFYVCWAFTLAVALALKMPFGRWEPVAAFFYMADYYKALWGRPESMMGIAWSLGVEEKFYLLWPIVFVALAGQWSKLFKLCLGVIGLVWLNRVFRIYVFHSPFRYFKYAFDTRVDVILGGCALALATRIPAAQAWFTGVARRLWWVLPTIALLVTTVLGVSLDQQSERPSYYSFVMPAQIVLLPIVFVQLITWENSIFLRPFHSRAARTLGDLSYGIYLYHYPLLWILTRFLRDKVNSVLFISTELLLPLFVAYLSHRFVEKPFLRLKRRFDVHSSRPASA